MNRSLVMFLSAVQQLSWLQASSSSCICWISKSAQAEREIFAYSSLFQSLLHQISSEEDVHSLLDLPCPAVLPT
ncbi:unnamed protein product [Protopolystoma xenopodis]|uniref:Uncharacterized protein n=1 Tax=Protopolystoma xenopodis TaxID=117903 RepID=A0A3S5AKI3_9PLAT|nr:unnamed protein product [Protopolystoma xenopodis]